MTRVAMTLLTLAFVLAGVTVLQVFLSRRASRWPGLALPGICLLYALVMCLNATTLPAAAAGVLLGNIPTLVLLAVYTACREGRKRRSGVEKMNIQDL